MELVLELRQETLTIDLNLIQLETEDVLLQTPAFLNAESTVVQTKEISVLKLMLDAQDHHTRDHHSTESVQNSLSAETPHPVMCGERPEMVLGDH
jgi:hypothetical protein